MSWLIWELVYSVLTTLWLRAARWSLLPLALILAGNLVITVLAVKRGTGNLSAGEKSLVACCALALGAWCLVRDATAAAALAVSVELAAAVPTTVSAWRDRAAESLRSWRWGDLGHGRGRRSCREPRPHGAVPVGRVLGPDGRRHSLRGPTGRMGQERHRQVTRRSPTTEGLNASVEQSAPQHERPCQRYVPSSPG